MGSVGGKSASRVKKVGGPGRDLFKMNYSLVDVSESPEEIHPTGRRLGDPVLLVHKKAKQKEMKTNSNSRKNKSFSGKRKGKALTFYSTGRLSVALHVSASAYID